MHKFLKLGKYTINPSAIAYIDWDYQIEKFPSETFPSSEPIKFVKVHFNGATGNSDSMQPRWIDFEVDSPEAKALHKYFYEPHIGYDLLLLYSQEEQDNEWLESRVQYGA